VSMYPFRVCGIGDGGFLGGKMADTGVWCVGLSWLMRLLIRGGSTSPVQVWVGRWWADGGWTG
jgi:hypothetical protein